MAHRVYPRGDYIEYLLDHTPKSTNGTFSKRLGKLFLLLYNTVQITLEILLIVLVTCNCSFWWKEDTDYNHTFNCGKMIALYLFFLSLVNQFTFFCTACIFAKLTKTDSD